VVIGDTFMLRVLNEELYYQVDRILIVEPSDIYELEIVPGMDYVTLITCTPHGINSHRMLVRGVRTDPAAVRVVVRSEARSTGVLPALAVVLAPIVAVWIVVRLIKLIFRRR
jgi:sortase A